MFRPLIHANVARGATSRRLTPVSIAILAGFLALSAAPTAIAQSPAKPKWSAVRAHALALWNQGNANWNPSLMPKARAKYANLEKLRLQAVKTLRDAGRPEAAAMLFDFAVRELNEKNHLGSHEVLRAIPGALAAQGDNRTLTALLRQAKSASSWELRVISIDALGRWTGPAKSLDSALLEKLAKDRDLRVGVAALRALARRKPPGALDLAFKRYQEPEFALRDAAMDIIEAMAGKGDVTRIIHLLPDGPGRVARRVHALLRRLTGGDFAYSQKAWNTWWESKKRTDAARGSNSAKLPPAPKYAAPKPPSYYGMRVDAERVVFVVDISGSMNELVSEETAAKYRVETTASNPRDKRGPPPIKLPKHPSRLDVARAELIRALWRLPEKAFFNVVIYSSGAARWRPRLVPATKANREEAVEFAQRLGAFGGTNIWDGLEKAVTIEPANRRLKDAASRDVHHPCHYESGPDTVFFLTDGEPTMSRYGSAEEHATALYRLNLARGLRVNTVGIGKGHDAFLLKRLAQSTGGKYVNAGN